MNQVSYLQAKIESNQTSRCDMVKYNKIHKTQMYVQNFIKCFTVSEKEEVVNELRH